MTALLFVLAAATGTLVRWQVWTASRIRPLGTLAVNVCGAFLLGLLAEASAASQLVGGVAGLGALTTFSTFAAEIVDLHRRDTRLAVGYATITLVLGVAAAWLGLRLA